MLYSASGSPIAGLDTTSGAVVELLSIKDAGDCYEIEAAVDGVKIPQSWLEPRGNVHDLDEPELMQYLKEQAVTLADYYSNRAV